MCTPGEVPNSHCSVSITYYVAVSWTVWELDILKAQIMNMNTHTRISLYCVLKGLSNCKTDTVLLSKGLRKKRNFGAFDRVAHQRERGRHCVLRLNGVINLSSRSSEQGKPCQLGNGTVSASLMSQCILLSAVTHCCCKPAVVM